MERIGEFRMTGGGAAITVALEVGQYPSGHTALVAVDAKTGEQLARLSVDFPDEEMAEDEIYLKDYAENERLAQAALDDERTAAAQAKVWWFAGIMGVIVFKLSLLCTVRKAL